MIDKTESLKFWTSPKRAFGKTVRCQDSTNISAITLKQYLSHVLTKRDLTVYLSTTSRITLKILTVDMFYHTTTKVLVIQTNWKNMTTKKANTLVILLAADTVKLNSFNESVVSSPDTNIFILSTQHYLTLFPPMGGGGGRANYPPKLVKVSQK